MNKPVTKERLTVAAANVRWGSVVDDNHADALWIADTVREGLV